MSRTNLTAPRIGTLKPRKVAYDEVLSQRPR